MGTNVEKGSHPHGDRVSLQAAQTKYGAPFSRTRVLDCHPAVDPRGLYVLAENHQESKSRLTQRDAGHYGQGGDLCTTCTRARREPY